MLKIIIFFISWFVPRNDRTWLFMAGEGDRFADNSKYLFLHCEDKENIRNIWIGTDQETIAELRDNGYEAYLFRSIIGKYFLFRAGVLFNTHGPIAPEYTGGATVVQLTHGNYLKKMLEDYKRKRGKISNLTIKVLFERRRYFVVTSGKKPVDNLISMRGADKGDLENRILVTGFPRNDVLFKEIPGEQFGINKQALINFKNVSNEETVLLYAPTHRGSCQNPDGVPLSELEFDFNKLDNLLSKYDAHLYISPHPATDTDFIQKLDNCEHISLLRTGGDLYPFLRECDTLITDYSGIFYDYLLLNRPILFYAPDLNKYEQDRGLYVNYREHVPGPIAEDQDEFFNIVKTSLSSENNYIKEQTATQASFYENSDGNASERVYQAITNNMYRLSR